MFANFMFKTLGRKSQTGYFILCVSIVLIGGCFAFPLSFIVNSNVLLGLALLPVVFFYNDRQRFNYAYVCGFIFFAIIAFHYGVRIFYFFTLAFFILFLIELFIGKVNKLMLFLLVFMSPFFQQITVIIGFPIRLKLSAWAGEILSKIGYDVHVEGNMMMLNGSSFTVDEACMGLNMLVFSMLMGVFALAYQYRIRKVRLSFSKVMMFFVGVFCLDIICNLVRIMILVMFKISPENPMHEIAGLLCFCVYVIIPIYFISQYGILKAGKPVACETGTLRVERIHKSVLLLLSILILFLGIHIHHKKSQAPIIEYATVTLAGFQANNMNNGITKLYNEQALVYVKPIPEFFTSEHTPLLCWNGSGYHFEGVRKTIVEGHEIYIGQLAKSKHSLYTAWWYSNGSVQTVNQFDWRMRMLKGEKRFCLINVTANDEAVLHENLRRILQVKLLSEN